MGGPRGVSQNPNMPASLSEWLFKIQSVLKNAQAQAVYTMDGKEFHWRQTFSLPGISHLQVWVSCWLQGFVWNLWPQGDLVNLVFTRRQPTSAPNVPDMCIRIGKPIPLIVPLVKQNHDLEILASGRV